jgi:hypothetical protein
MALAAQGRMPAAHSSGRYEAAADYGLRVNAHVLKTNQLLVC